MDCHEFLKDIFNPHFEYSFSFEDHQIRWKHHMESHEKVRICCSVIKTISKQNIKCAKHNLYMDHCCDIT